MLLASKNKSSNFFSSKGEMIFLVLLFFLIALLYPRELNLATSDLGRHIKNGEIFFKEFKVISTNYYSYTQTDYPFPTHHWCAGVFYYLVYQLSGFPGLTIFNAFLMFATVLFFYLGARMLTDWKKAVLFSFAAIPLIIYRPEVRPEVFSYLFFGANLYLMIAFQKKRISFKRAIIWFSIITVLWVNVHLFFVLGLAIPGAFLFAAIIKRSDNIKYYMFFMLSALIGSMISPFGPKALIEPFTIMHDFEVNITENTPVPFIENDSLFGNMYYLYFKISSFALAAALIITLLTRQIKSYNIPYLVLAVVFCALGWMINRTISFYGLVMVPAFAVLDKDIGEKLKNKEWMIHRYFIIYLIMNFFLVHLVPVAKHWGLGITPKVINSAADFYKNNDLEGPMLNTINNGGYLIFHLFPQEKVFIDARPEAYPPEFIRDVYRPMLTSNKVWRQKLREYGFNTIFFYKRFMTDYEIKFIRERVKDPDWEIVYNDEYNIILKKARLSPYPYLPQ